MKKFLPFISLVLIAFALQSCIVSKQPNMAFFDNPYYDFKDAKFTSVNVPMFVAKPFIKKALKENGEDNKEIIAIIKKVKKVRVLTIENGNAEMLTDFSKFLENNNYKDWATITQKGQKINIKALQPNESIIKKLMLTVKDGKDFVLVDVKGNFTTDDISNIINASQKSDVAKE